MKILKMNAFGDFDSPYDIDVCAGKEEHIEKICNVLNDFCQTLPGCEKDVSLSIYLADENYFNSLMQLLVKANCFSEEKARDFLMLLFGKCVSSVYVYRNTFSSETIVEI